jgi:hypothetical protein
MLTVVVDTDFSQQQAAANPVTKYGFMPSKEDGQM